MPRGYSLSLLVVCGVLMNGAGLATAQQAIGLRPSLDEDSESTERPDRTLQSQETDDGSPSSPEEPAAVVEEPPISNDQAFVDSALLPPPPPGGIRSTLPPPSPGGIPPTTGPQPVPNDQREVTAPVVGPYDPLGLRVGAFTAFPALEVTGVVTDNVQQSDVNRQTDIGLRLAPELRLQSDWVRHSYTLNANGELIFYDDNPDFDEQSATVTGNLLLDVRRSTTWDTTGNYTLSQTSPSSSEVPDSASGRRTDQEFGLVTRVSHRVGSLIGRFSAGLRYLYFDDVSLAGGGVEDNSDRNYFQPSAELRLSYEHTPAIRPFAELRYAPRLHQESVDRAGLRRDSHGGTVAAGMEFDLSPLWSGELALRYDVRAFEDSSLKTVHSGGVDAAVVWRPSELTTVRWNVASELEESASSGVSAIRSYVGSLEVAHALRENLIVTGTSGLSYRDRIGTRQNELQANAGLAVSYLLSREAELLARYNYTMFETFNSNSDYIENQFTAGFRYRL